MFKSVNNPIIFGLVFEEFDVLDFETDFLTGIRANYFNSGGEPQVNRTVRYVNDVEYSYVYSMITGRPLSWKMYKNSKLYQNSDVTYDDYTVNTYSDNRVYCKLYFDRHHTWLKSEYFKDGSINTILSPTVIDNQFLIEKLVVTDDSIIKTYLYPKEEQPEAGDYAALAFTDSGFLYFNTVPNKEFVTKIFIQDESVDILGGFCFSEVDFNLNRNLNSTYDISTAEYLTADAYLEKSETADEALDETLTDVVVEADTDNVEETLSDIEGNVSIDSEEEIVTDTIEDVSVDVPENTTPDVVESGDTNIVADETPDIVEEVTDEVTCDTEVKENVDDIEQLNSDIIEETASDITEEITLDAEEKIPDSAEDVILDADEDLTDSVSEDVSQDIITEAPIDPTLEPVEQVENTAEEDKNDEFCDDVLEDSVVTTEPFVDEPDTTVLSAGNKYNYYGSLDDNGKRSGHGRTVSSQGKTTYEGEYLNDKRDGFGSFYFKNGDINYVGSWKENKRNGFGTGFRSTDGISHTGKWSNNTPEGIGARFDKDGNFMFLGNFVNGKKQGIGITVDENNRFILSVFSDDEVVSSRFLDE